MKSIMRALLACGLAASLAAAAAETASPCEQDPRAGGIAQRIENIRANMDRIEWATNPQERKALLDLHTKTMQEVLREVRRREAGDACRAYLTQAMLEQLLRHQLALSDRDR